jgi:pyruvate kinase
MISRFEVIATVNTHLLNPRSLKGLAARGATILRINGSHAKPSEVGYYAREIRSALGRRVRILMDLPGNKIRTADLSQPIVLRKGSTFELHPEHLNYPKFLSHLTRGDILLANDSLFRFEVVSASPRSAVLLSHTDGQLTSNKGVHLTGKHPPMPFLFRRDRDLIREAVRHGVDTLGLSFVRDASDVRAARAALKGAGLSLIVKVETAAAVRNLDAVLDSADEFLVDRGDLSCDVGIENVERYQKMILRRGKAAGKRVYFATQFLHSMVKNNVPLIAEACGLTDAVVCGVDGVQMSEETAIGQHPFEVLDTIRRMRAAVRPSLRLRKGDGAPVLWLTGPSGGGKTTLTRALERELIDLGYRVCVVDGDDFRAFWGNDAGYTKEDRLKNQRNMIFTAYQASRAFDLVIVSSLSPYRALRALAREKIPNFHEVHVDCPLSVCRARDPKGHYARAALGRHANFVGVTEEYEKPLRPELRLDTGKDDLARCLRRLLDYCLGPVA